MIYAPKPLTLTVQQTQAATVKGLPSSASFVRFEGSITASTPDSGCRVVWIVNFTGS